VRPGRRSTPLSTPSVRIGVRRPVLIAVVGEFAAKAKKAARAEDKRVAVIELEQAGDSAKVAAEADANLSDTTREAILEAHLAICIAKSKL
jgi:hypothetical protein